MLVSMTGIQLHLKGGCETLTSKAYTKDNACGAAFPLLNPRWTLSTPVLTPAPPLVNWQPRNTLDAEELAGYGGAATHSDPYGPNTIGLTGAQQRWWYNTTWHVTYNNKLFLKLYTYTFT